MEKYVFIEKFLMETQNKLCSGIKSFLNEISEDSKYYGEMVTGICCLYEEEKEFFYLENGSLKKEDLSKLPEPPKKPFHECSAAEIGMGLILTDDSYKIQEYLKCTIPGHSYSKTSSLPMNSLISDIEKYELVIVFACSEQNEFLRHALIQFGNVWMRKVLIQKSLPYIEPEHLTVLAVESMAKSAIDVRVITQISSLKYEGEKCDAKIAFIKKSTIQQHSILMLLENKITFKFEEAQKIRKLLQLSGPDMYLFIEYYDNYFALIKAGTIIGIGGKVKRDDEAIMEVDITRKESEFSTVIKDYFNWILYEKDIPILKFVGGRYMLPKKADEDRCANVKAILASVMGTSSNFDIVIDIAAKQKHGTTLIITNDAKNEAKRLCDAARGYLVYDGSHGELNLINQNNIIDNITGIDGAIIMDCSGVCYGIGVILDGYACVTGDSSRGARYNSAKNYIAGKSRVPEMKAIKYAAIVLSEDRYVDSFTTDDDFDFIDLE